MQHKNYVVIKKNVILNSFQDLHRLFSTRAFTLIELLVTVLIIGILAAVAVPQYKKAVEKTKAQEVLALFPPLIEAVNNYYLANGEYPTLFNQLDIEIPWTGKNGGYHHSLDQRSNKNWGLGLYNSYSGGYSGPLISFTRISGPYTGTRFVYSFQTRQLYCVEHTYGVSSIKTLDPGAYCVSIMGGLTPTVGGSDGRWYKLP